MLQSTIGCLTKEEAVLLSCPFILDPFGRRIDIPNFTRPEALTDFRRDFEEEAPSRAQRRRALTPSQILEWADAHRARTGNWPSHASGRVAEAPWKTWSGVNAALRQGTQGLPGNDSLARLLRRAGRIGERRGRPRKVARHHLVCQLLAEGVSLAEIGRRLGVSRQAAWEMFKRNFEAAAS